MSEWVLSYKALKVVSNYEILFFCHTEYIIRSSFAIPVHKTREDSRDKGIQFVLKAAPQHQTSDDAYLFILNASLDSVPKELKNLENLDSDFNVLKADRNLGERKTHLCAYVLW